MKNISTIILILIFYVGCKSQTPLGGTNHNDVYAILNSMGKQKKKIYRKSFTSNEYNSRYFEGAIKQLWIQHTSENNQEQAYRKIDSLKSLHKQNSIKIDSAEKKIIKQYLQPDIMDFLTNDDLKKMAATFLNKSIKWDKERLKYIHLTSNKGILRVSVPVFSVDNTVAAVFKQYLNSLSLDFYKKDNKENWSFYASGWIYRAD